ncbi:MAG: 50S ribosomal protein L11 methyltransferase [Thermoplasmataceae archaeon]
MALHVKAPKEEGQHLMRILSGSSGIDRQYSVQRIGDTILIPVTERGVADLAGTGYEIVNAEPLVRKKKPQPVQSRGSYDAIGRIAVVKKKCDRRQEELARSLVESGTFDTVFMDHGISGDLRLRDLEIKAGRELYVTDHRENGITLRVNVARAYFSPRLATERLLVAKSCRPGDLVLDMFAGIGPFSITIAKIAHSRVVAVDKNPVAIAWMIYNINKNRVGELVTPHLMDSRQVPDLGLSFDRIVMNLPHGAMEYIDEALSVLNEKGSIHLYLITDLAGLEAAMTGIGKRGLRLVSKRVVHGYSPRESLYSLYLRRNR